MQNKQVGSLNRANQSGFTLIELIVVIVILGILAATALPRFANLGGDARLAKANAARGAVQSAASLTHGQWLVAGGSGATVTMEGTAIALVNGYPAATSIATAAGLSADYTVTNAAGVATITDAGKSTCTFTYTEAAASGAPTVTAPSSTNCQ